jgi:hypothetical protein
LNNISYVVYPVLSAKSFKWICIVCSIFLFLFAIFTPNSGVSTVSAVRYACDFGNQFPMIRVLNRKLHSCYLPVSYGGAIVSGFVVGVLFCFSEFRKPVQPNSVIPDDMMKRWFAWALMIVVIASAWLIQSPAPARSLFDLMSSNRITVGVFASIMFGAHVIAWAWMFIAVSVKIREMKWKD